MSATLVAKGLSAGFGARQLFRQLDLVVAPGDVIGLVGVNGAGKSTLLRMLAGLLDAENGSVRLTPPTATVGYLAQEPERRPGETVLDFLGRRTGVTEARLRMDAAAQALADRMPGADGTYAEALDRWLALGGADLDERTAAVAADIGLAIDVHARMPGAQKPGAQKPGARMPDSQMSGARISGARMLDARMTELSGGQAARVGLASLLLSRFDVFLLDEPTNDLDLDGLARLETFVGGLRAGVVVVSHDREFLARTVTGVLELDLAQQQVGFFGGGYQAYLDEREVARRHARESYEEYETRLATLKERALTQRNWMDSGVRNARRKATDNDKIGRKTRAETSEKQAAKARQTQRMIERLDVVEEPRKEWELRMRIAAAPRSGSVVAVLTDAVVRRPGFLLGPVTAQLDWADRVAVTGSNGAGKSTLLAALLGRIELAAGRSSLGPGVVVGEVDQARTLFNSAGTLLEVFGRLLPDVETADLRTLLAKFALRADHVRRACSTLSPGERTRAGLALLQARGVNLLVLDEPTNHLDLPAIEQLEAALADYAGTLLLVTHDRRMLDAVHTTRRWHVEAGQLTEPD